MEWTSRHNTQVFPGQSTQLSAGSIWDSKSLALANRWQRASDEWEQSQCPRPVGRGQEGEEDDHVEVPAHPGHHVPGGHGGGVGEGEEEGQEERNRQATVT